MRRRARSVRVAGPRGAPRGGLPRARRSQGRGGDDAYDSYDSDSDSDSDDDSDDDDASNRRRRRRRRRRGFRMPTRGRRVRVAGHRRRPSGGRVGLGPRRARDLRAARAHRVLARRLRPLPRARPAALRAPRRRRLARAPRRRGGASAQAVGARRPRPGRGRTFGWVRRRATRHSAPESGRRRVYRRSRRRARDLSRARSADAARAEPPDAGRGPDRPRVRRRDVRGAGGRGRREGGGGPRGGGERGGVAAGCFLRPRRPGARADEGQGRVGSRGGQEARGTRKASRFFERRKRFQRRFGSRVRGGGVGGAPRGARHRPEPRGGGGGDGCRGRSVRGRRRGVRGGVPRARRGADLLRG